MVEKKSTKSKKVTQEVRRTGADQTSPERALATPEDIPGQKTRKARLKTPSKKPPIPLEEPSETAASVYANVAADLKASTRTGSQR